MQWMMLQQDQPKDYVIASGEQHSVRDFIIWTGTALGINIQFEGSGINEVGVVVDITGNLAPKVNLGQEIVRIDSRYFRPAEVETLLGDPSKAKNDLGWEPQISVKKHAKMVEEDYKAARRTAILREHDLELPVSRED